MGATLVVERHHWETSGSSHQVQFPKAAHSAFFGGFTGNRDVRVFNPPTGAPTSQTAKFSYYTASQTIRINRVLELGQIGHACVFIEEIRSRGVISYDLWWFTDPQAATILASPWPWQQGRNSQHGPGRFWAILPAGPRTMGAVRRLRP